MAPSPLEALKQGYEKLKKQVGRRKKALEDRLANKERIPDDDLQEQCKGVDDDHPLSGALSAAQTLRKYTETLDDGFACKLEQLLASFGCQTQLEETNALLTVPIKQWFTRTA
ncbi:hypothetical protein B0H13DRAFT_2311273 [Mycena leptocephala]|nr:hypothetical protein B0H13DRAFT_2311273 [Mycena leptocephala]